MRRQRRLAGFSVPDSAAIDSSGSHLYVCSERPFRFSFDSQRAAANTAAAVGAAGSSEAKPASEASPSPAAPEQPAAPFKWRWIQSEDELHVTVEPSAGTSASSVTVPAPEQPPAITKAAVECSIGPDAVRLAIGGTRVFGAEDQLFARIDSSQSTWLISDQKFASNLRNL